MPPSTDLHLSPPASIRGSKGGPRLFPPIHGGVRGGLFFLLVLFFTLPPALAGDLYLNLIWHQHQPLYLDPERDELRGPWVRTHATKDYYDMAAMHQAFPEVHATINLTSSLLTQLQSYYVDRLEPFLYQHEDSLWAVRADSFLLKWKGQTDPWIDLALRPSATFDSTDMRMLLTNPWNAFGISAIQIARFPEYQALRDTAQTRQLSAEEMTAVKSWFYLAHFDPDFLRGTAALDVNLTDLLAERDGRFYLRHSLTERDANRLVADAVRVMREVIPVHKRLMYDPADYSGQLEIITTPFYHPILPLLIDSDVARVCQPRDSLPPRYAFPADARAQVARGMEFYRRTFGRVPRGMWPAEGSISEAAAALFLHNRLQWFCGDMRVLARSTPANLPVAQAYRLEFADPDRNDTSSIAVVFRETTLSDHIGFTYQNLAPDSAARHFLSEVLKYRPSANESDRLLTVILDGENAWEWYAHDVDAKRFLHQLYTGLTEARVQKTITCVTPTEYFSGNPTRGIPRHPIDSLARIERLWPGSWINANYDTWIGEPEENQAWEYLLRVRQDLETSGLPQPDPVAPPPDSARARSAWRAWEAMYAAEGSDWFWWYGADQSAPGSDLPFEQAFFSHLRAVYRHMREAGVNIESPQFEPILSAAKLQQQLGGGVMARGAARVVKVKFVADARAQRVPVAIFIAGNLPELGSWQPNTVSLYDDGTHGDAGPNDGLWTLEVDVPVGTEVQYKYTNSGQPGQWVPSEEFPSTNRSFTVEGAAGGLIIRTDVFGEP